MYGYGCQNNGAGEQAHTYAHTRPDSPLDMHCSKKTNRKKENILVSVADIIKQKVVFETELIFGNKI